jgi:putative addiction module killer protein
MKIIHTTEMFDAWFASLRDKRAVRRIQARIDRIEDGNFGDCGPVGEGVSEMRIHHGPGYRCIPCTACLNRDFSDKRICLIFGVWELEGI